MGLCIYYSGTISELNLIDNLTSEVKDICDNLGRSKLPGPPDTARNSSN